MASKITARAPGRICLFGEHQDFLELAVIAAPIDLFMTVKGTPRSDNRMVISMPDIDQSDEFPVDKQIPYRFDLDFLRAATNVVRRSGVDIPHGYDCTITGNIPINAGTSSSSALVVAWVQFLLSSSNGGPVRDPERVAHLAYEAEVPEFNAPGGMMDHYASALGGLIYIDCREPISVQRLPGKLEGLVLGNTGVRKNNNQIIAESRSATRAGLEILAEQIRDFDLRTTPFEQVEPHLADMDSQIARRVRSNFVNRDLCQSARGLLSQEQFDQAEHGRMLHEHQVQLRDGIGVSHPKLDELIDAAMEAGALGGKLNGSGGGGCMFAYAPGKQQQVAEAIQAAGGQPYIISVSDGVNSTVE